ncbi:hypothetical protein [Thermococcus piezophilus]|uniref:Enolpyruvate transferase domain-containing protein n=1 Tax=Thermococcus piezophilus TaxID=1712654 RepID=A0A172WEZ9_9EURY|nr:hypothetical protein [Thermococcus piezophilus]ANF21956.1 hypothetical protein A7C91_01155 [Thermococcus piezophilus]
MGAIIRPVGEVTGEMEAPPSKSYTHRAYFLALLAEGRSVLRARQLRFKESDRVRAMAVNLSRMGIRVRELPDGLEIEGEGLREGSLRPSTTTG